MRSIEDIADEIVAREGGYVNDPADPGGPTNHGVTLGTLRRLGIDMDGDGAVGIADVRALGRDDARAIFIDHYYRRPGLDALPEDLQPSVFDMYVNAGDNAVRILQRLLRDMGQTLRVDGIVGPQTSQAATWARAAAPRHLIDAYGIARRNYYYLLAEERPSLRKFAVAKGGGKGGWIARAEAFITPRYRMTPAEHSARVSAWA
jgi:lysozyme family protein